ncbi:hypothetical protein A6V39_03505 [Candidatus Mycoplasma haematobovis]|uniref:Uncharacterized protein n=1 Tax=Candidatus Mycoplasma haematobovis TaxID=432608 RepID=A0A1A9QBJ0_9MOLU|nr:hypothetical protein [Candidatus Mycoplasma haematobovis]OAL09952.1 hypothetical protein A6V39_03505 [Candidatus Mycoplasma haematobovis]
MFNLTTNKIVGIAGGIVGTSAIGGSAIYFANNNKKAESETVVPSNKVEAKTTITEEKSISDWLRDDGSAILGDTDSAWRTNWKTFKDAHNNGKVPTDPWKLDDWSGVSTQEEAPESFKSKCKSNANTKVNSKNDERYTTLKKYCTKQGD